MSWKLLGSASRISLEILYGPGDLPLDMPKFPSMRQLSGVEF